MICLKCNKEKVIKCKGLCHSCYIKSDKSKPISLNCKRCSVDLSTVVKNGEYCHRCYSNIYKSNKECKSCGSSIKGSINGLCKPCRKLSLREQYNTSDIVYQKVEDNLLEVIRMLLLRYKYNIMSPVDNYRVVDVYYTIYEDDNDLDVIEAEDQIIYMIKQLHKLYINK